MLITSPAAGHGEGRVEGWRDGGVEGRSVVPMTRGGQRGPPGMTPGPPTIAQNGLPGRMKKCPSTLAPVSRTAVGRPGRGEERREKTGMYGGGREGYTGEAGSEYLRNDENVAGNGVLAPWRNKKC